MVERIRRAGAVCWALCGVAALVVVLGLVAWVVRVIWPPLILAGAIVFLLNPVVTRLQRRHIPRARGHRSVVPRRRWGDRSDRAARRAARHPAVRRPRRRVARAAPGPRGLDRRPLAAVRGERLAHPDPDLRRARAAALRGGLGRHQQRRHDHRGGEARTASPTRSTPLASSCCGSSTSASSSCSAPIIAFYLLVDLPHIRESARALVPERARGDVMVVSRRLSRAIGGYFRGQLAVALVVGIDVVDRHADHRPAVLADRGDGGGSVQHDPAHRSVGGCRARASSSPSPPAAASSQAIAVAVVMADRAADRQPLHQPDRDAAGRQAPPGGGDAGPAGRAAPSAASSACCSPCRPRRCSRSWSATSGATSCSSSRSTRSRPGLGGEPGCPTRGGRRRGGRRGRTRPELPRPRAAPAQAAWRGRRRTMARAMVSRASSLEAGPFGVGVADGELGSLDAAAGEGLHAAPTGGGRSGRRRHRSGRSMSTGSGVGGGGGGHWSI